MQQKMLYCLDCNREIPHKGRCLPCNKKLKVRREAQENFAKKQE